MTRAKPKTDPRVTKRRVTMISYGVVVDADTGKPQTLEYKAVDYVRPDHLDEYVAKAQENWAHVTVSDEPDAGPGGYHGQTVAPDGTVHPETPEAERD